MNTIIETFSLYKNFKKSYQSIEILKNINLKISKGEKVAVLGKSGAGKTTLLHILGTLEPPSKGTIAIDNIDITKFKENELSKFRGRMIGFVFQHHYLINEFTAFENIVVSGFINNGNKKEIFNRADYLLDKLGILHRKYHKPSELSGGEQQRVAIARALINNPSILMADEPTGNLDSQTSNYTFDLLEKIHDEIKMAMIVVTHNLELSERFDRKIFLKDGEIISH